MHDDLATNVDAGFARTRQELEDLVRIPSISAPDFDAAEVRRSAEAVAALLLSTGVSGVRLLEIDGAHPAVYGEVDGPPGAPTVLLYAHHDIQPPGPVEQWDSGPFEPVERDGRLYGRGAADDKAGVLVHVGAIRAFDGSIPVNVKLFIEGEEEVGSTHVDAFIDEYGDLLAADVVVIADSGNWMPGLPSLTTSLRGLVDCTIEVQTLDTAVHSGEFGGTVPDAITVLSRIIASLHNDDGSVAIPGLVSGDAPDLGFTEEMLRAQTGAVDGLELIGSGTLTARTWRKPAVSVLALDAPPISQAINQIVPSARAKLSMRIPPGQDPEAALTALVAHLESATPWGAQVTVTPGAIASPIEIDTTGPASVTFAAALSAGYGQEVVEIGVGGTIPIVAALRAAHPEATIVLNGVADRTSSMHGPNESVSLADLRSGILAEAIALRLLAESA
jgi:acetylornithine deacetylase/succinyl-diaminopimelate desuccinylase-like protein